MVNKKNIFNKITNILDSNRSHNKKIKVMSSQFNYQYRNRIHFPYSIASLLSYVKTNPEISENCIFEKTFVFRNKVDEYVKRCKNADVILCSCYVWNWEITVHLAEKIKKLNPNCTIIFGGPQVPNHSEGFFDKYPFVDIIVHGEGEHILENLLKAYMENKDYSDVLGIETKHFRTNPQPRINDLTEFPSPYLTNLVWDLVEKEKGIDWIASWETNRGCPYSCTFCDWGSATATRMRNFSEERLFSELEWFGNNKTVFINCCDANFGIYQDRDSRIAKKIKSVSLKTGYPEIFRLTWAKFSSERIIPIAKTLQEAGILHAVTLAVQSLDAATLKIIKRENIKFEKFSELTESFRSADIPTYTEIIMGLPGETLESFKHGLQVVAQDTKIDSIQIYNCSVLPNAPMNEPSYRDFYKIQTIRSPIYLAHSSIHNRELPEYEDISISSNTFSTDDIKEEFVYAWFIQTFSSLGISEQISTYYNKIHSLSIIQFCDIFLEYCKNENSIFSDEYQKLLIHIEDGYSGKGWDHHDSKLGDIFWPFEEASWARLASDKNRLENEFFTFLKYLENKLGYDTSEKIVKDLIKFNVFLLTVKDDQREIKSDTFDFNWKNFFIKNQELKLDTKIYSYPNLVIEEDPVQWAWKSIWFGRANNSFKFHTEKLHDELIEIPQIK